MSAITDIQLLLEPEDALKVYDKIFTSRVRHEIFFKSQIEKRGILWPAQYTLRQDYSGAFLQSVTTIGENSFYISVIERVVAEPNDWLVSLKATPSLADSEILQAYQILENAIYSTKGKWGLWFSSDNHAILGGSEQFVDTFYSAIGRSIDDMVMAFIKGVRNKEYVVEEYLPRLFGEEQAEIFKDLYKKASS